MAAPLTLFYSDWKHNLSTPVTSATSWASTSFSLARPLSWAPIHVSNCLLDVHSHISSPQKPLILHPWQTSSSGSLSAGERTAIYSVIPVNNLKSSLESGSLSLANIPLLSEPGRLPLCVSETHPLLLPTPHFLSSDLHYLIYLSSVFVPSILHTVPA